KLSNELGHIANLDVDVFMVNDVPYILEMNARFGGGYPFSHIAGIDLPKAIINWVQGKNEPELLQNERIGTIAHKDIDLVILKPKLSNVKIIKKNSYVDILKT